MLSWLQGGFTNWLNNAPLTETSWLDKTMSKINIKYITRYVRLANGSYTKYLRQNNVSIDEKQPGASTLKNCTGALTDLNLNRYIWIAIGCEDEYEATFICQTSKKTLPELGILHYNQTCEDGWFNINHTSKCFSAIWTKTQISYQDAHGACSARNASVYSVGKTTDHKETWKSNALKDNLIGGLSYQYPHKPIPKRKGNLLQTIISGRALDMRSLQNTLPFTLYWTMPGEPHYVSFFANYTNTCSIVDFSIISFNYILEDVESHMVRGWGVKHRPCSQLMDVAAIICEKPSSMYEIQCAGNHFECQDKTCILMIYRCDFVLDCFGGDDEHDCISNYTNISQDQLLTLPCLHGEECDSESINIIPVHSVCDGVYQNNTYLKEITDCPTFKIDYINLSQLSKPWEEKEMVYFDVVDIANLFIKEEKYLHINDNMLLKDDFTISNETFLSQNLLQNLTLTKCNNIDNVCKISLYRHKCTPKILSQTCKLFTCPGMFKCTKNYCIFMSSVCDGQYDCKNGEDEMLCSELTCPGSLKCRGENRCVSTKEICDDHINCQYSMDDEIGCHKCPEHCKCNEYVVACNFTNMQIISSLTSVYYVKGILLKFSENIVHLRNPNFTSLVYLNLSFSLIEHIKISEEKYVTFSFLLIADFSHNKLTSIDFLEATMFQEVRYLDLSFNLLSNIEFGVLALSSYLMYLALSQNNLEYFTILSKDTFDSLSVVDMRYISYYSNLDITIDHDSLEIIVSDSLLCCMLSNDMKCTSHEPKTVRCYGLLDGKAQKNVLYAMSILSISLSVLLIVKESLKLLTKKKITKRKKWYLICYTNQLITAFMASVYLVSLSLSDFIEINILVFRNGNVCLFLNALLYMSLECKLIFKIVLTIIISLKIIYPFKHQCVWLRWTGHVSVGIWLFMLMNYLSNILYVYYNGNFLFDNLCSLGWCGSHKYINTLQTTVLCVDSIFIFIFVLTMIKTYVFLKMKAKFSVAQSTKRYSENLVVFRMVYPNISEITLRLYLLCIFIFIGFKAIHTKYCTSIFIFAMPISIICTSFINLFK